MAHCIDHLQRYAREGNEFLARVVAGDDSWCHHFETESKRQSPQWKHRGSPPPKKIQGHPHKCTGKVMLTFFFDQDGPPSDRLRVVRDNSQCPVLLTNLDHSSPSDQIEMTRQAHLWVILLHDNARPHMANTIMALLQKFKWEVLGRPPYSSDLSPCDYVIFGPLEKALRGI